MNDKKETGCLEMIFMYLMFVLAISTSCFCIGALGGTSQEYSIVEWIEAYLIFFAFFFCAITFVGIPLLFISIFNSGPADAVFVIFRKK